MNSPVKYLTLLLILWSVSGPRSSACPYFSDPHEDRMRIVIDAGHGGHDHGCSGSHSKEKILALEIAIQLGQKIESELENVEVIYTRKKDVFVPLFHRADIANKKSADLFISIHCNAISNSKINGTETFVMGLHRTDDNLRVAKQENKSILLENNYKSTYGGYDPDSPEGHILMSLFQNAYLTESLSFASLVEAEFEKRKKTQSRGVKQAGFVVLRATTMPSVLIETGFLTNKKEEELLRSKSGQGQIVRAIFNALLEYKKQWNYDRNIKENKHYNKAVSIPTVNKQEKSGIRKQTELTPTTETQEELTANTMDHTINFSIQIAATSKAIAMDQAPWDQLEAVNETKSNNIFKYSHGQFNSYEEAKIVQQKLLDLGFQDAFLIAFEGNKQISITDALKRTKT